MVFSMAGCMESGISSEAEGEGHIHTHTCKLIGTHAVTAGGV